MSLLRNQPNYSLYRDDLLKIVHPSKVRLSANARNALQYFCNRLSLLSWNTLEIKTTRFRSGGIDMRDFLYAFGVMPQDLLKTLEETV